MENTGMDRDLGNGSIERTDPKTGKKRIISGADAARTALTRKRDAEESRKAGAPPIATGGQRAPVFGEASTPASTPRYQTNDRALNVARAKEDGQFDSMRARFNATNTGTQMDEAGQIVGTRPVGRTTLAPSDPNNPDSPLVPTPQGGSARPAAPQAPRFGARQDGNVTRNNFGEVINPATGMVNVAADNIDFVRSRPLFGANVAMAAGPNISTAPTGLPQGSIGAQRADGSYSVTLADGTVKSFANEAAARAGFSAPAAAAPAAPMASSPAPAPATATNSGMAPVFTAKGIGQRLVAGVGQLASDQTAANPANFIDTAERYGTAAIGALWNGEWNVPEKGLIRQGVEAINEAVPIAGMIGSAIGNAQAQARQREAIAAGRIAPDFNERAARAEARYRRQANGAPSFAQMEAEAVPVAPVAAIPYGDPRNPVRDVTPAVQQVTAAASAPPVPVATPTNAPKFAAPPLLRRKGAQPTTPPRALEFIRPGEPAAFPLLSRSATRPLANLMAFA